MALIVRNFIQSRPREGIFVGEITFDDEYPSLGEEWTAASVGFDEFYVVSFSSMEGYIVEFNYADELIVVRGALGEVDDLTDLSGLTVRVVAYGAPA